jgi:endonuclease/exonuclease/phosphatase family metal-dependent hydrolase
MAVSSIPARAARDGAHLRIWTHNIFADRAGWTLRRRVLIDGVRELQPDLITLQETMVTEGYDQVADVLDEGFHIVHSRARETGGQGISIASRWPISAVHELDLSVVSARTGDFACTTLIAEIDAPAPFGPVLLANHFPDYQVDHELERERQTVIAARALENMVARRPMHVIVAGDLDAEPDAASLRFLTGKQSLDGLSVCYRNAWDSAHPGEPGETFTPENPLAPPDWPFRRIDHILVRCGRRGGPTLRIAGCEIAFAEPVDGIVASDHYGLVADLMLPPETA